MPPGINSRHIIAPMITRIDDGLTFLLDREPFRFVPRPDNLRVTVEQGDSWHSLAAEHLQPIPRAQDFWWILADYQPDPVIDPTIQPEPGSIVFVPAPDFVLGTILADTRTDEVEI